MPQLSLAKKASRPRRIRLSSFEFFRGDCRFVLRYLLKLTRFAFAEVEGRGVWSNPVRKFRPKARKSFEMVDQDNTGGPQPTRHRNRYIVDWTKYDGK